MVEGRPTRADLERWCVALMAAINGNHPAVQSESCLSEVIVDRHCQMATNSRTWRQYPSGETA